MDARGGWGGRQPYIGAAAATVPPTQYHHPTAGGSAAADGGGGSDSSNSSSGSNSDDAAPATASRDTYPSTAGPSTASANPTSQQQQPPGTNITSRHTQYQTSLVNPFYPAYSQVNGQMQPQAFHQNPKQQASHHDSIPAFMGYDFHPTQQQQQQHQQLLQRQTSFGQKYESAADNESSSEPLSEDSSSEVSWITWFCSLPEHDYFIEVPEEYIEDGFNLVGLNTMVPLYDEALDMILDLEVDESSDSDSDRDASGVAPPLSPSLSDTGRPTLGISAVTSAFDAAVDASRNTSRFLTNTLLGHSDRGTMQATGQHVESSHQQRSGSKSVSHSRMVESSAEVLYGLIHARYILTKPGLQAMAERVQSRDFGRCPRSGCGECAIVPCGRSDTPGVESIKMYCPRCNDMYHPKKIRYQSVDGAYFGTTFASMLFLNYPAFVPAVFSYSGDGRRQDTRNPERAVLERARAEPLGDDDEEMYGNTDDDDDDENDSSMGRRSDDDDDDDDMDEEGVELDSKMSGAYRHGADGVESQQRRRQRHREREPLPDYWMYYSRIFGFRVSERSVVGPRMGWLRWKEGLPEPGVGGNRRRDTTATTSTTAAVGRGSYASGSGVGGAEGDGVALRTRGFEVPGDAGVHAMQGHRHGHTDGATGTLSASAGDAVTATRPGVSLTNTQRGGPVGMLGRFGSLDETGIPDDEEEVGDDGMCGGPMASQVDGIV